MLVLCGKKMPHEPVYKRFTQSDLVLNSKKDNYTNGDIDRPSP